MGFYFRLCGGVSFRWQPDPLRDLVPTLLGRAEAEEGDDDGELRWGAAVGEKPTQRRWAGALATTRHGGANNA